MADAISSPPRGTGHSACEHVINNNMAHGAKINRHIMGMVLNLGRRAANVSHWAPLENAGLDLMEAGRPKPTLQRVL